MLFLGQAAGFSFGRAVRHLLAWGTRQDSERLRRVLAERYGAVEDVAGGDTTEGSAAEKHALKGSVTEGRVASASAAAESVALYRSGRAALKVAFEAVPARVVIVPGLTCIAVVRAARAAGYEPIYCDIERETLQYDFEKLEQILAKNGQKSATLAEDSQKNVASTENNQKSVALAKNGQKTAILAKNGQKTAVLAENGRKSAEIASNSASSIDKNEKVCYNGMIVVQNTLGRTLDIGRLEKLAQRYNFAIIEDLAHSAGRFYADGREVGTVGAATVLSFGKGKAIDTTNGGAVILRGVDVEANRAILNQPAKKPRWADRWRDRWYPIFGWLTRTLWPIGLGRPLLSVLVRLHWIEKSADTELDTEVRLTHWQAKLALQQLPRLATGPLREHYLVPERDTLLNKLERRGYHLGEIWYDTPVAPARYTAEAKFPT